MLNNKIGIIIQARTGSTRLPNKVLLPFWNGMNILELMIEKIKKISLGCKIIIATSESKCDSAIVDIAKKYDVNYFRGDENDVLNRFIHAAEKNDLDKVIRVCSDNPFINSLRLKELIDKFAISNADYLAYSTSNGIPTIKTHFGLWGEAVTLNALKKVASKTSEKLYQEHVTNYIYTHNKDFLIELIPIEKELENRNDIRLTIDTYTDFENLKIIYEYFIKNKIEENIKTLVAYIDSNEDCKEVMKNQIEINSK